MENYSMFIPAFNIVEYFVYATVKNLFIKIGL